MWFGQSVQALLLEERSFRRLPTGSLFLGIAVDKPGAEFRPVSRRAFVRPHRGPGELAIANYRSNGVREPVIKPCFSEGRIARPGPDEGAAGVG